MTLTMADSIYPTTLPAGYDAYLGYTDGDWPTIHGYTENGVYYPPLAQLFPGKPVIGLTVTGATLNADGCDIETGDLSAVSGAVWLKRKLATAPRMPPVAYCSVLSMPAVLSQLSALGVPRGSVLLLSAHYGVGEHICGPSSCQLIDLPQDGTQWTDAALGAVVGTQIDASLLASNFFGGPVSTPAFPDLQPGWQWCVQCQSLFYEPERVNSVCPATTKLAPGGLSLESGPHWSGNPGTAWTYSMIATGVTT